MNGKVFYRLLKTCVAFHFDRFVIKISLSLSPLFNFENSILLTKELKNRPTTTVNIVHVVKCVRIF